MHDRAGAMREGEMLWESGWDCPDAPGHTERRLSGGPYPGAGNRCREEVWIGTSLHERVFIENTSLTGSS